MISVVIITLNEADQILDCIKSVQPFSDDIVVVDANSVDDTVQFASKYGCRVFEKDWNGYGEARNFGAAQAFHNWIFSIDADERCSPVLCDSIANLVLDDTKVYTCTRHNFLIDRYMRFGYLKPERKIRLYNRHLANWDDKVVHEQLILPSATEKVNLQGPLYHIAYPNLDVLYQKLFSYADKIALTSRKDKNQNLIKMVSPLFHFIRSFIFQLGFVEGKRGWQSSCAAFQYHKRKYARQNKKKWN